jgi:hypothetical protein
MSWSSGAGNTGGSLGIGLTVSAGLTAKPRPSPKYIAVHRVALYAVLPFFFSAYIQNPIKPMRWLVFSLLLSLRLRLTHGFSFWTSRVELRR